MILRYKSGKKDLFMNKKIDQNIILIGFMGAGKTTVGKELSRILRYPFIDLDQKIEDEEGRSIPEIFQAMGEPYFRKVESEVFANTLIENSKSVISTGGGIILLEKNRRIMDRYPTILLNASVDEIYRRVSHQTNRPLLQSEGDLYSRIGDLYSQRIAIYQQVADFVIDTDRKEISDIVEEIIHRMDR